MQSYQAADAGGCCCCCCGYCCGYAGCYSGTVAQIGALASGAPHPRPGTGAAGDGNDGDAGGCGGAVAGSVTVGADAALVSSSDQLDCCHNCWLLDNCSGPAPVVTVAIVTK